MMKLFQTVLFAAWLPLLPVHADYSIRVVDSRTHFDLAAIHFPTKRVGFAVGSGNFILRTQDEGKTWENLKVDPDSSFSDVWFLDESNGFILSERGLFRTNDGGGTWATAYSYPGIRFKHVAFHGKFTGIISSDSLLFYTADGGLTWSIGSPNFLADQNAYYGQIRFASENTAYVAANVNLLKTTDGGRTWSVRADAPDGNFITSQDFIAPEQGVFASLYYGGIWRIHESLQPQPLLIGRPILDVVMDGPDRLLAIQQHLILAVSGEGEVDTLWTGPLEMEVEIRPLGKLHRVEPGLIWLIGKKGLLLELTLSPASLRPPRQEGKLRKPKTGMIWNYGNKLALTSYCGINYFGSDGRKIR